MTYHGILNLDDSFGPYRRGRPHERRDLNWLIGAVRSEGQSRGGSRARKRDHLPKQVRIDRIR